MPVGYGEEQMPNLQFAHTLDTSTRIANNSDRDQEAIHIFR